MQPTWYALVDGAQDPRLADLVQSTKQHICLFKGRDLDPALVEAAPWLVRIDPAESLLSIWQQHGHAANWGLMLLSDQTIETLRAFFRRFLQAKLPDGTIALFRFYDPRVFNTYMRSATPAERAPWFAQVSQYAVEGEGGTVTHNYRMQAEALYDGNTLVA